jgi:hypothetical protein
MTDPAAPAAKRPKYTAFSLAEKVWLLEYSRKNPKVNRCCSFAQHARRPSKVRRGWQEAGHFDGHVCSQEVMRVFAAHF